jgi:hypothetical protein
MLSNGNEEDKRILKCISTNNIRNQQKSKQQKKNCINKVLNIFILIGKMSEKQPEYQKKRGMYKSRARRVLSEDIFMQSSAKLFVSF